MTTNSHAQPEHIATLYKDHHGWLRLWLRKKLGCTEQAADLTHDTFLRVLGNESLGSLAEPRAFLTTVAQRVLSNHWRREKIERTYLEALALAPREHAFSPEERALMFEALIEIDRLLDGLAPVVRRAFLLTQLDGMSHGEVAATLGISIATVKRYIVKAGAQCYFAELGVD